MSYEITLNMTVERAETSYSMKGRLSKIKVDETQDIGQLSLYFSYMVTVSFIAGRNSEIRRNSIGHRNTLSCDDGICKITSSNKIYTRIQTKMTTYSGYRQK